MFHSLFLLLIFSLSSAKTLPQLPRSGTAESPVELKNEPHHRLRFENDYVRVWDTFIPAGDATLWHRHVNDNVAITLDDANVRVETVGAETVETQFKRGGAVFRKAPYVHRTTSIGKMPFHNLAIEILKSPRKSRNLPELREQIPSEPIIDNEIVRVYQVTLAPGESTGMVAYPRSVLWVAISLGEVVMQKKERGKSNRMRIAVGDVRWLTGPGAYSVKNVGQTEFEALYVELN